MFNTDLGLKSGSSLDISIMSGLLDSDLCSLIILIMSSSCVATVVPLNPWALKKILDRPVFEVTKWRRPRVLWFNFLSSMLGTVLKCSNFCLQNIGEENPLIS